MDSIERDTIIDWLSDSLPSDGRAVRAATLEWIHGLEKENAALKTRVAELEKELSSVREGAVQYIDRLDRELRDLRAHPPEGGNEAEVTGMA